MVVESLSSTIGLTPDLVTLSRASIVVVDAELPGLSMAGLLVLARSLEARRNLKLFLTSDGELSRLKSVAVGTATLVARAALLESGASALGVKLPEQRVPLDVRALLDEVLGSSGAPTDELLITTRIDLFSRSNFYADAAGNVVGVFVATSAPPQVGQKVHLTLDLLGKTKLELKGEVEWLRGSGSFGIRSASGVGVRVIDLRPDEQAAIARLLHEREPLRGL